MARDSHGWALVVGGAIGVAVGVAVVQLTPTTVPADDAPASVFRAPAPAQPVRLVEEADEVQLRICARRYDGPRLPNVWVVGVLHLAEPGFYAWVDDLLADQDVVLYEGVEGPPVPGPEAPGLGDFAEVLGLVEQSGIDTTRDGWRNSDMRMEELEAALYAAGAESDYVHQLLREVDHGYGDAIRALSQVEHRFVAHARHTLMASLTIPPATGDSLEDRIYRDVLIGARDAVVMDDLLAVTDDPGVRSVGILYGVAHLDDLDRRLREHGWHHSGEACQTAMRVGLREIGLGHVQLRQVRERMLGARLRRR